MEGIFNWLQGKKTYMTALLAIVLASLEMFADVTISDHVYMILGALGFVSLRDGVNKLKPK